MAFDKPALDSSTEHFNRNTFQYPRRCSVNPVEVSILAVMFLALCVATLRAPRLTSTLVWTFIAATLIVSALAMNLPGDLTDILLGLAMLYPLLWAGLQFWCYWDRSKWRVAGGHIAASALSAVIISISTPL